MSNLLDFFDDEEDDSSFDWRKEWVGMPEYVQEKEEPFDEVTVRFKSKEDKEAFFKLIEQNIPDKLKSIWFPKLAKNTIFEMYTDES